MVKNALALALLGFLSACDGELEARTQLMLVTDTDVPPPGQIFFEIVGPDKREELKDSPFMSGADLPRTLALVHTEGELGPFEVTASIRQLSGHTITRTHTVWFARGKTLLVPLHLARACEDVAMRCPGQVCTETAACIPGALDSSTLEAYNGQPGRVFGLDGGAPGPDAGAETDAATPDASVADAGPDAATDFQICGDQNVDILSDVNHCGDCGVQCPTAPAGNQSSGAKCVAGKCELVCDEGWGDCNKKANNGCEVNILTSEKHCGECDAPCEKSMMCMIGECGGK